MSCWDPGQEIQTQLNAQSVASTLAFGASAGAAAPPPPPPPRSSGYRSGPQGHARAHPEGGRGAEPRPSRPERREAGYSPMTS